MAIESKQGDSEQGVAQAQSSTWNARVIHEGLEIRKSVSLQAVTPTVSILFFCADKNEAPQRLRNLDRLAPVPGADLLEVWEVPRTDP